MKSIPILVSALIIGSNSPLASSAQDISAQCPIIGNVAPSLSLFDASKRRHALSDGRGRRALLITFFPRCFTGNCASQLTSLRDSYPALQKAGVEVWAVSTDPADGSQGQRAFSKHLKLPFPLFPDTDRKISLAYGAVQSKDQMAARMSVFIDKNGIVRWIDKQINPRTHGADVLARIRAEAKVAPSVTK